MQSKWFKFAVWSFLAVFMAVVADACAPMGNKNSSAEGEYLAFNQKLFSHKNDFRITDTIVYPNPEIEGFTDPSTSGTGEELTRKRCYWCHNTCGFEQAFDWEHYGTKEWSPQYQGDEWLPILRRMMDYQDSLLSEEEIVRRIYSYLSEVTTGTYDKENDERPQVKIEVTPEEFEQLGGQVSAPGMQEEVVD